MWKHYVRCFQLPFCHRTKKSVCGRRHKERREIKLMGQSRPHWNLKSVWGLLDIFVLSISSTFIYIYICIYIIYIYVYICIYIIYFCLYLYLYLYHLPNLYLYLIHDTDVHTCFALKLLIYNQRLLTNKAAQMPVLGTPALGKSLVVHYLGSNM